MKLCRFNDGRLGLVREGVVFDVSFATESLPQHRWPFPASDAVIENLGRIIAEIESVPALARGIPLTEVSLRSCVGNVPKIVAAPVNYHAHVDEVIADPAMHAHRHSLKIGEAGLFLKAPSSLVGPGDGIRVSFPERRTDHEVELVVVIGTTCKDVPEGDALDVVAGYCIGLDITLRGVEDRSFRKSLDTYTVLGPWLTTRDEISDPDALSLELSVNGEPRQSASTSQLIFDVRKLISWASSWYTLYPGDVLMTGTPQGVGPIVGGDRIDATITGLGSMTVAVRDHTAGGVVRL
jgi:2,4-didehydro-3-deoxy-L-rhamnonate hydrolase